MEAEDGEEKSISQQCADWLRAFARTQEEYNELALEIVGQNQESRIIANLNRASRAGHIWRYGLTKKRYGSRKRTLLMHSAKIGDLFRARFLIENGANVNDVDILGKSALSYACEYTNNEALIEYLLDQGSLVNTVEKNEYGFTHFKIMSLGGMHWECCLTPLHWAVLKNNYNVVRLLLSRGALLSAPFPRTDDLPVEGPQLPTIQNINKYRYGTAWIPLFFCLRSPGMGEILYTHFLRTQRVEFDDTEFYQRRTLNPLTEPLEYSTGELGVVNRHLTVALFDYDIVSNPFLPNSCGNLMPRPIHELTMTPNTTDTLQWLLEQFTNGTVVADDRFRRDYRMPEIMTRLPGVDEVFEIADEHENHEDDDRVNFSLKISALYLLLVEFRKDFILVDNGYSKQNMKDNVKVLLQAYARKGRRLSDALYDPIMLNELEKLLASIEISQSQSDQELILLLREVLQVFKHIEAYLIANHSFTQTTLIRDEDEEESEESDYEEDEEDEEDEESDEEE